MELWHYIWKLSFLRFTLSVIVTLLAACIIFVQTEKKTKILAGVILAWVAFVCYENWMDFQKSEPRPNLILYRINQKYDNFPNPTSVNFDFIFKNTGEATAYKITVHQSFFIDKMPIHDGRGGNPAELASGETGETRFKLEGPPFTRVWNEESSLTAKFILSYQDSTNNEYQLHKTIAYKSNKSFKGMEPGWSR